MSNINQIEVENTIYDIEDSVARSIVSIENNISVAQVSWVADSTYSDYGFRATIPITGITASHFAFVTFDVADVLSGFFAPVADTYNGGIYIYSTDVPDSAIVIPSIAFYKEV